MTDLVSRHSFAAVDGEMRKDLATLCRELTNRDDLRLAGYAATALGALGTADDAQSLLTLLDRSNNIDPVVRHQASMGLLKLAERHPALLDDLADYAGTPGRLGVLLAMRRQGNSAIAQFLKDGDSSLVAEAARAINDEPIEAAQFALADLPGTPGLDDNTLRRSMNARYRRGFADDASAVARIAADAGYSAIVRAVAAELLATWNKPQNLDTVTGRWRPLHSREVQGLEQAVSPHLPGMLAGSAELRQKAVDIATELGIKDMVPALQAIMHDTNLDDALRTAAFRALSKLSPDIPAVLRKAGRCSACGMNVSKVATSNAEKHCSLVAVLRRVDGVTKLQPVAARSGPICQRSAKRKIAAIPWKQWSIPVQKSRKVLRLRSS